MTVKTRFSDSKPRTGRMSVGKSRSSGNGGENMYSNERRRVSMGKTRSSGNGDENLDSEDQQVRRTTKGKSSQTERRRPSTKTERVDSDYGEKIKDSKPRNGRVSFLRGKSSGSGQNMNLDDRTRASIGKGRSFRNGDENINLKYQRGRRGVEGHSSRSEKRDLSSRTERSDLDSKNEIKVRGGKQQGMNSRGNAEKKDMGNDGNEEFQSENISMKRKRVFANKTLGNVETSNRNSMSKLAKNEVKKRLLGREKFEKLGVDSSLAGQKKYMGSEDAEKKTSLADNTKKSANKKVKAKKVAGNDNAEEAEQPRKNKRIRIDPYDFSNKRIDDGLITAAGGKEKKQDLPKSSNDGEMSLNAQFRAIRPSESILSYVEDNLLGRRREIEMKRAGYNIDLSSPLDNIPFSTSPVRERIEEPAFRNKLEFFAAAKISSSFPPFDLPEIAFAGRSNVGKSSILNALTRQWGVVRTSDKPGLTQSINFFNLGSKLCLVDLPGYGFAYAKEETKEAWEELVKEYVSTRVGLKRVCLLVDTKWGMKPRDYELVDLMERSKTKYQIVLTKTDLVFPIDVARRAMQIEESLKGKKSAVQPAIMVSSRTGAGIQSFRAALSKIARFIKP